MLALFFKSRARRASDRGVHSISKLALKFFLIHCESSASDNENVVTVDYCGGVSIEFVVVPLIIHTSS